MFGSSIFKDVESIFDSAGGKKAVAEINSLTKEALPIVQEIATLTGNAGAMASVAAVTAAYDRFGIPLAANIATGTPAQIGTALQTLAVTVLQKNLPTAQAATATNLLNTAVNLAVSAHVAAVTPVAVA